MGKLWEPKDGDYLSRLDARQRPLSFAGIYHSGKMPLLPIKVNYGWLPRQDQIQEMFNYNSRDMTFNYDTGAGQHLYSLVIDLDRDSKWGTVTKLFEVSALETSNWVVGLVVPIPTFPSVFRYNCVPD